jgi:(1->4)-alpha-D-glucan 1-alpha-D-glucosylmutase
VDPDLAHEQSLQAYARCLLGSESAVELVAGLVADIECAAATNSLSSVVLRAVAPGVPDVYQGDEVWRLDLVDPDNRRPVAWSNLQAQLASTRTADLADLMATWRDGRLKQWVVRRSLNAVRRRRPPTEVNALEISGRHRGRVIAIARSSPDGLLIGVAPTRPYAVAGPGSFPMGDAWDDTTAKLPGVTSVTSDLTGTRHPVTGGELRLADVLRDLPVALLRSE